MSRAPIETKPQDNIYTVLLAAALVVQLGACALIFIRFYQLFGEQLFNFAPK